MLPEHSLFFRTVGALAHGDHAVGALIEQDSDFCELHIKLCAGEFRTEDGVLDSPSYSAQTGGKLGA